MASLEVLNLEKSYGKHKILHSISFEIKSGQFLSLLGPSGSGKTTILRCIAGLERPDYTGASDSHIKIGPREVSGQISNQTTKKKEFIPPEKRNLGMVFQNYAVWPHLNVYENVAFPLKMKAKTTSSPTSFGEVKEKTMKAIECVKLTGLEKRYAFELSGGQQQRVALARALAMSPEILLLDEPLSNLDALLREELGAEIRRLQQKLGLTTILVTHDQKEALTLSDQVIILNGGKIDALGTPEELYAKPPTPFSTEFLLGRESGFRKRFGDMVVSTR